MGLKNLGFKRLHVSQNMSPSAYGWEAAVYVQPQGKDCRAILKAWFLTPSHQREFLMENDRSLFVIAYGVVAMSGLVVGILFGWIIWG